MVTYSSSWKNADKLTNYPEQIINGDTVVTVIKVTPSSQDRDLKTVVNIYTFTDEHFED